MKYKRIKTLKQYTAYCNEYEELRAKGYKKDEEIIDLLELLIEDFDNRTISKFGVDNDMEPVELMAYLMSEQQLTKSALARELGVSRQLITEILNYKINISKRMVMKLADFFKMMPIAFSREYQLKGKLTVA